MHLPLIWLQPEPVGLAIKNDSIAGYSPYIQYVVTIFMILFGINFSAYFLLLSKKLRQAIHMEEVRWYLIIIFASIVFISFNARAMFSTLEETIRHVSFQVASVITTTGFATTDFDLWPEFSRTILVILMFIGACAGSTGGGIKVSRFILLIKTMKKRTSHLPASKKCKKNSDGWQSGRTQCPSFYECLYDCLYSDFCGLGFTNQP